jgi:hypothetical protein
MARSNGERLSRQPSTAVMTSARMMMAIAAPAALIIQVLADGGLQASMATQPPAQPRVPVSACSPRRAGR